MDCIKVSKLVFFVNGKKVIDDRADPEVTLLRYLREKLHLCGTKLGCAEGGCGACTVMISQFDRDNKIVKHRAVNACLMPVCALHGLAVTTVEGIGSTRTRMHPVQERIAKAHGTQCGFCTPGIVMSMYALLRNLPKPNLKDLETALQGNLCRCTGYRPILDGYKTFTKEFECGMGKNCCKVQGNECDGKLVDDKLFEASAFVPYDPSQEPIFPPELKLNNAYDREILIFENERGVKWFRPNELKQLLEFKRENPSAKVVAGNTEIGIEVKFKHSDYKYLINVSQIKELNSITFQDNGIKFGAAVTLDEIRNTMQHQIEILPEHETRIYQAIDNMMNYFSSQQTRNVASAGGSIMTGTPISDLNPIFLAASVELEVESVDGGKRKIEMNEHFFTGYRLNVIKSDEILLSISIPKTTKNQFFLAYKQSKRRDDDIAIVNAAFNITLNGKKIQNAKLAFGGMAPTTVMALKTAKAMIGLQWNRELVEIVNKNLIDEIKLSADAPGGVVPYRRSLTLSLFFKAFLHISQKLEETIGLSLLTDRDRSGLKSFQNLPPKSTQLFEKVSSDQPVADSIHRPQVHSSAFKQATGEALYCDDIPKHESELYVALVLSSKAHAKIISIDASEALNQPGVQAFFSAKDLDEKQNNVGHMFRDEELFKKETITSHGQILGAIVADNQVIAQRAARLVKVETEDLSPIILTIEEAIKHNSIYTGIPYPKEVIFGDYKKAFEDADHVAEGEIEIGGQEHFYLETQSVIAIPRDVDELEVYASTQQPCDQQKHIAEFLGIPQNKVVCKTKRIGGAFGGKESRGSLAIFPVVFAAYKLKKPVRMVMDRDEDMMATGGRNPFLFKYKVAFTKDGKIKGVDVRAFINAGYSMDVSFLVMEKATSHIMNAYNFECVRFEKNVMKTNTRSNTAFRGFGAPQAMLAAEHIIRDVARIVNKNYLDIMKLNFIQTGNVTHFKQILDDCNVTRCFEEVFISSEMEKRQKEVLEFNKQNRWKKRGISLTNTMFAVGFPPFLMQGGALINIYVDGSVLISHGGVEMGQGLHTKMIQIASRVLQIPQEKIHIQESSSDKVPNASTTAASMSSDLYGGAVMNGCQILYDRLEPFRKGKPDGAWTDWVKAAYFNRVALSVAGFYKPDDIGEHIGRPVHYFTHGSAVSEVEIDCLSGDHQVIRTDIVMDVGSSLNPAVDIGQIEGAFMQGYGLFTLEELIHSPDGILFTRGPSSYKIPCFADIPGEFNVSILTGAPNPRAVYSSRAIGEPPLFLASSVFFAIKESITAAREEENLDPNFIFQSPATSALIRMACQDKMTKMIQI